MIRNYTAKYTRITSGYMGQLVEWPEVITEGKDIEECRALLRDALREMILAYNQQQKEIPLGDGLIEQVPIEVDNVHTNKKTPDPRSDNGQRIVQTSRHPS